MASVFGLPWTISVDILESTSEKRTRFLHWNIPEQFSTTIESSRFCLWDNSTKLFYSTENQTHVYHTRLSIVLPTIFLVNDFNDIVQPI